MASQVALTGRPVLVPKPTAPASSPIIPAHACSLPSNSTDLFFPALGLPRCSSLCLACSLHPTCSLATSSSLCTPESPLPSSGLVPPQSPPFTGSYKCLCVFVRSVTLSLQTQGSWRARTFLVVLPGLQGLAHGGHCLGRPRHPWGSPASNQSLVQG